MKIEAYKVQLFFVLLGAFGNGICMTVRYKQQLYSYASLMVENFDMASGRSNTGYFAGLLTCAMMAGRTVSAPFWGYVCDNYGRKPVLLFAVFCTTIFSIAFGFTVNYWMGLAIRLLIGLTAPIGVVSKTCVAEIAPPHAQAAASSLYANAWLTGSVVGSIVGGLLVDPKSSGLATSGFFSDWPYLLPNLFTALISAISLVGVWIWMDETLKKKDPLLKPSNNPPPKDQTMWSLAKDPTVFLLAMLYGLNSYINTGYNELFPLWCWASKGDGGLNFSPAQIGYALAASNVVLVVCSQITFRAVVKKKSLKFCSVWGSIWLVPITFVIPWISYSDSTIGIWIYIIALTFVFYLLNFTVLTSQMVMSNNCVFKAERGRLNGLYMFLGSFARALAPLSIGCMFAATAESGLPFPLNYTFCFTWMSVLAIGQWYFSRKIPPSVEKQKEVIVKEEIRRTMGANAPPRTSQVRQSGVKTTHVEMKATMRSSIMTETGYHQFDEDSSSDEETGEAGGINSGEKDEQSSIASSGAKA